MPGSIERYNYGQVERLSSGVRDAQGAVNSRRTPSADVVQRIALHLDDGRGYYVGRTLLDLDRELRRVAREYRDHGELPLDLVRGRVLRDAYSEFDEPEGFSRPQPQRMNVPDRPDVSSLELLSATPGSADLWLQPVGYMVSVIASEPVIALVNSMAVLDGVRRVRVWLGRRLGQLSQMLGSEAGDLASQADAEEGPFAGVDLEVTADGEAGPFSISATGQRRITWFRQRPDGTVDVVTVE